MPENLALIVEDNLHDAELFVHSLKKNEIVLNMIIVEDGEEALNFVFCEGKYSKRKFEKQPSVIFLDLKLPKINGLQVLQKLKSNPQTSTIPIVIVTSSREESDISAAYKFGANSYVVKPVNFDEFKNIVNYLGKYWLQINENPK